MSSVDGATLLTAQPPTTWPKRTFEVLFRAVDKYERFMRLPPDERDHQREKSKGLFLLVRQKRLADVLEAAHASSDLDAVIEHAQQHGWAGSKLEKA